VASVRGAPARVGADGALNDGVVWNESPEGQGFGAAALALTSAYHASPKTIDNQPQAGALIGLQVTFGDKPPFQLPMVLASPDTECAQADPVNG
jgi:hypothetical protein